MTTHDIPTRTSHWTSGVRAPVSEEITAFDLPVAGIIPPELDGRFVRNGPNLIGPIDPTTDHWFTGHGMVHGLRLRRSGRLVPQRVGPHARRHRPPRRDRAPVTFRRGRPTLVGIGISFTVLG